MGDEKTGKEQICAGGNLELPIRHASFYCKKVEAELTLNKQMEWNRKPQGCIMIVDCKSLPKGAKGTRKSIMGNSSIRC